MKKTSFTFAKTFRRQPLVNSLSAIFTLVMLLAGNFAFGQIMDPCPPGSGNTVTNCPATGPVIEFTDNSCSVVVPDFKPGVSGVAGAGYAFVGVVQVPMAGDVITGVGDYPVQVGAAFLNLPPPGGPADPGDGTLCAEVCPTITLRVVDNKVPNISCAAPLTIDVNQNCEFVITAANVLQFVPSLTDNCTPTPAITLAVDVNNDGSFEPFPITLAGPSCPGPNPRPYTLLIRATDASGNSSTCISNPGLRDNSGPTATCNNAAPIIAYVNAACIGTIPNLTGLPTGVSDNCGGTVTFDQSPAPGTVFGLPCTGYEQPVGVTMTDCFGNTSFCLYNVVLRDTIRPTINTACGSLPPQPTLIANASCSVTIPDLRGLISVSDNCDAGPFNIVQSPAPGPLDVSGVCPPNNTISVTFTVSDCHGNAATPLVCNNLLTFTDATGPVVVCPPNPVPIVVPFNSATCEHGTAMVDLATLIAGGVTVTDNCDPNPTLLSVSPNMFMCPDIGKAGLTVTITAADCFGNDTTMTCPVQVLKPNNLTADWSLAGGDFVVCPADFPISIALGPLTPGCGTWIGDVAVSSFGTFAGSFDVSNWAVDLAGSATAQVNTAGAPGSVVMVSSNDGFGPLHIASFSIVVPVTGDYKFNWNYSSANSSPSWDPFGYSINGVYTQLTDDGGGLIQSGAATVSLFAGQTFAFEARSLDQCCGAATINITPGSLTLEASSFPDLNGDGVPDPGAYSLTYTVGAPGCHVSETHNIMISPQFNPGDATLVDDFSICLEATEVFDLEGLLAPGSIQGGLFTTTLSGSVVGSQVGNLWQYLGGDGTLTVTYTLSDCDADIEQDQVVISIDEKPDGHFSYPANFCQDEGGTFPSITGVPFGATISFASTPAGFITDAATGFFDPTAGPLTGEFADVEVVMTVTNGVCAPYTISQWIVVYASGNPAFTIPATICETDAPLTLQLDNPLNDGGVNNLIADNVTWTGTSVTDNGITGSFNPAVGPGVYTICVTVGAPSCEELLCHDIIVLPDYDDDDVALVANFDLCMVADDIIDFTSLLETGALPGGHFIITSLIVDGTTIVNTANPLTWISTNSYLYTGGCGSITVRYQFDDDCSPATPTSDQVTINFEGKPDIGGVSLPGPLCATDAPVTITYSGTPNICNTLGTFSGAGVNPASNIGGTLAQFNPAAAGEGVHFITYSLNSPTGICDDVSVQGEIRVKASSPATFVLPSTACPGQVINLALANPDPSVTTTAGDLFAEVSWFGGDGLNGIVTDNLNGTGTFVGTVAGTYTVCVLVGEVGCMTYECHDITVDNVAPVMSCAPFVRTRNADPGVCTFTMPGTGFDVTATDNCSALANITFVHNYPSAPSSNTLAGATFPVGSTIVTWTATDQAGNSSNCSIEIIVVDNQGAQVVTCPSNATIGTNITTACGATFSYTVPTFSDNCDGTGLLGTLISGYAPNALFPLGTTTVTWRYTDLAGNPAATCSFTVTVIDDDNPVFVNCPTTMVMIGNDPDLCSGKLNWSIPVATDNCGIASIIQISGPTNGTQVPVGVPQTVTYTATDINGNTATCTFQVQVVDTQKPEFDADIVMPGNVTVECNAVPAAFILAGQMSGSQEVPANASTACGTVTGVLTGNTLNLKVVFSGLTTPASAAHIHSGGLGVNGPVIVDLPPLGFPLGVTSGTFTANVTLTAAQVTALQANGLYVNIHTPTYPGGEIRGQIALTTDLNDNCTAPRDILLCYTQTSTQDPNPNVCGHYNYTITRTWKAIDQAGNERVHVQVITVKDTTPPVPVCQNTTVTLDKTGVGSINPATLIAGTTDNCAPFSALTVTASQTSFTCANLGQNNVTLTINDPCLNQATCTIVVTVQEGIAPCTPQATLASTCLNNATTLTNGQFRELITVKSLAMQTWTVTSSTGLFTDGSAAPPAAPTAVANGTAFIAGTADGIDNDGDGQIDEADEMIFYTLRTKYVEAIGYSATLTNNLGQTLNISNVAHYPTPILVNFFPPFCLGTPAFVPQVVDQFAGANAYTNIMFFVDGQMVTQVNPALLSPGQHTLTVKVNAGTAAFSRRVNGVLVTGDAVNSDAARLDPGCEQSIDVFFQVITTPSQVVCNDLVNVSLEADCSTIVTQDMVLEGTYQCFDDYEVRISYPNGIPLSPPNVVTSAHVGLTLPYMLWHPISGNVCWGNIKVEDKLKPVVTCPPAAQILCTVNPDSLLFGQLFLGQPTVVDCSSWTFEYTDDYTTFDCAVNPSVAISILRTFVVTDAWGNQSTCTQQITKLRGEASQVTPPADKTYACNDPQLATLAPNFNPAITGWPKIAGYNLTTTGTGICGLGVSYTDEIVNLCTASYKVVRTWKIFDWCPASGGAPTTTTFVQYIKVENLPPSITVTCQDVNSQGICVLNATLPGNPPHTVCAAQFVPFATVQGVCDNVTKITVETPAGNTTNGGLIPSPGLPLGGPYNIIYRAEDECGNITQFTLTVVVEDKVAPIAVCDEITDVNLSSDGYAEVFAATFDDGSHDNCCLDHFEVRRMTDPCNDNHNDLVFGPSVKFCCADIGAGPVTVVFRAYDCFGNFNDCMVTVNVNDKVPPILVSCPANTRITCDKYASELQTALFPQTPITGAQQAAVLTAAGYGSPTYFDNCVANVTANTNVNLDLCLEGTITRTWSVQDGSGNNGQNCTQTIWVDHVSDWAVEFPEDKVYECTAGVTASQLDSLFGVPKIFNETCELVGVSYTDEIFNVVPDACYKVLRTWTVINWCVVGNNIDQEVVELSEAQLWNQGVTNLSDRDINGDGFFNAAEVNSNRSHRTYRDSWNNTPGKKKKPTAADNPTGNQSHSTVITDPDTDPDSDPWDGYITYQQTIKVKDTVAPKFANGCQIPDVCISDNTCAATVVLPNPLIEDCSPNVVLTKQIRIGGVWVSGANPILNVAPGTYEVRYNAMDQCNNQQDCNTTVTVKDCKKPTPYCKNGLVVEIMQTGMVQLWASDFDAGSFDNCTPQSQLKLSFSANVNETGRTYNCDSLGQRVVRLWVTDLAGNQDFCETFVEIQNNMGACNPGGNPLISGLIQTETNQNVSDVDVQLSGTSQASMMTTNNGMFSFTVVPGGDYTVTPVKDTEPLNGVTTFDLVLITKHILGSQLLDSPYKIIAADANKSNSVTTFDLVQLRKLILFIDTDFPNNTSWRFVDKDYIFPNPSNPWSATFPEVININDIAASQLAADFVAVKIGDVNGSAQPNFAASPEDRNAVGTLVFAIDDVQLKAGNEYTVEFKARDFNVLGYQFTLNFDRTALEFVQVNPAVAGIENFGLTMLDKGAITTSWNDNDTRLSDNEVVFSLVFKATANVKLSEALSANSRYTVAEAYKRNGDLLDIGLAFNGTQQVAGNFELYQNTPNPFSTSTVVGFNLPEASAATLKITDVSGKVVKTVKGDFAKGYNEIRLERRELPATGILYYQLDTQSDSATKMMLLMD